jgi:tripartite-type tricarboxylate transporter receptor subunit TctC
MSKFPLLHSRRSLLGRTVRISTVISLALAAPLAALADGAYPDKPIKFVVPYPPGGGTDVVARIVQQRLQAALGQPIVIDNKGGAGGSLGTDLVAKAAPDGYTVLFTLSSHTINPAIFPKLPFDTIKDFEPVGLVASLPQLLAANMAVPVRSVADVVAQAKAAPDKFSFASVGNGSPGHLAGELMVLRTGAQIAHIPYRGGGPAVTDVIGGQVPLLWVSIPAAAAQVKAGKLRPLAVSTTKRSPAFPDVPTMQEAGVPDFEVDSWYAMMVPAKTPRAVIDKLNKALNTVLAEPAIRAQLLDQGADAVGGTPEALGKVIAAEVPKWIKLAKDANIKAD